MTGLTTLLLTGNVASAEEMVKDSAFNINKRDVAGDYPIGVAINYVDLPMLDFLISHGANVNIDLGKGWTPLHDLFATAVEQMIEGESEQIDPSILKMIRYLIDKGADLQKKDADGQTPLEVLKDYAANKQTLNHLKSLFRGVVPEVDGRVIGL